MTTILLWILYVLAAILVLASVLPLSKIRYGAIRGLAFMRLQMFWLSVILICIALLLPGGRWVAMVLAFTILVQMIYITKFTPIWWRQSVDADDVLRGDNRRHVSLLAANVKKSNRSYDELITMIKKEKPDIAMAIEVDQDWITALQEGLSNEFPHWVNVPKETGYGMCVMSRLTLSDPTVREVVTDGVPSIRTGVTLRSGAQFRLYVVHPEPPVVNHDTKGRDGEIAHIGIEASQDSLPAIVTGDLNDVAWSTTTRSFQRLSGLLDPRVGRGFYNTFNAFHWWARWPLDHLFHDAQFRYLWMERLGKISSDHFPMMFKLALANEPAQNIGTGEADAAEEADIQGMIAKEQDRNRGPIGSHWEDD